MRGIHANNHDFVILFSDCEPGLAWCYVAFTESDLMAERRRLERFNLAAPAQLTAVTENRTKSQLDLTTKDISSAGAYLYCTQPFEKGARVNMELLISLRQAVKARG